MKFYDVCNRTDIQTYFGDAAAYAGIVVIRRNGEESDEVSDYFVFVAWACRLLQHWSLFQRQQ
jgi:hypothetical protein